MIGVSGKYGCSTTSSGDVLVGVSICFSGKCSRLSCESANDCMWKNGMALFGRLRHVALLEDMSQACFISTLKL